MCRLAYSVFEVHLKLEGARGSHLIHPRDNNVNQFLWRLRYVVKTGADACLD